MAKRKAKRNPERGRNIRKKTGAGVAGKARRKPKRTARRTRVQKRRQQRRKPARKPTPAVSEEEE